MININKCYPYFKQLLDFIFALVLLVVLLPLSLVIVCLIRLDSSGPAIFRQKRVGMHGKMFTMYKFRTMHYGAPNLSTEDMQRLQLDPVTRIGRLLRKTSIDELPQIVNVLFGDMSFIGPRPALPSQEDVNRLREEICIHKVRPGITGLAQVMGRDDLSADVKVNYDAEYCRNMCLLNDVKIVLSTLSAVLYGNGNK